MRTPFILVCFKTELSAFGGKALELAKICESVSDRHGVEIAVSPHVLDIRMIAENTAVPVFAQYFDPVESGKHTGRIPPENLKLAGAAGVIINHSEMPLGVDGIRERVDFARNHGLTSVVCCRSPGLARDFAGMGPNFISYEPPECIGSTTVSVSTAKAEALKRSVDAVAAANPDVKVACGAGVRTPEDVRIALKLGAKGFLVSTAVVKSKNPRSVMEGFCKTIMKFG